jgi:hypothetical protein
MPGSFSHFYWPGKKYFMEMHGFVYAGQKKFTMLLHRQILMSRFMKNQTDMNKKTLYILGVLCIIASAAMYFMGKDPKLTELGEFWWIPLPIAALLLIVASRK